MKGTCNACGKETWDKSTKLCRNCYLKSRINRVERVCLTCSKKFVVRASTLKFDVCNFCSIKCRGIWQSKERIGNKAPNKFRQELKKCLKCGKEFYTHSSEIKKKKTEKFFCSLSCWYSYNQLQNHCEWRGGQHERLNSISYRWRKAVLKRDSFECRFCGSKNNLEIHHIIPFNNKETRWEIGNGITLCQNCHKLTLRKEEQFADNFFLKLSLGV